MTLNPDVLKEASNIRSALQKRGVKIVDDSIGSSSARLEAKVSQYANSVQRAGSSNKFKKFYSYLMESGLYIAPKLELAFGEQKEIPLDEGSINSLTLSEEAYNANLTFTILTCLLQNTSVLYFGPPGSGKTTTSEFVLSGVYNIPLSVIHKATIYGHPELTEEKMLAFVDIVSYLKNHEEVIGIRDFMKTPARIIDEVNRIPPGKLSILYQILDRGWTVYNNRKIKANPGPLFATANASDSGNYEVPPAFIDRFDLAVVIDHLNPFFIGQFTEKRNNKIRYIEDQITSPPDKITSEDIVNARKEIYYGTQLPNELVNKIAHFLAELNSCEKAGLSVENKTKGYALFKRPGPLCQDCSHYSNEKSICFTTENGLSPRTISTVYAYSKALSWWRGKSSVTEDELKYVIGFASWFKLQPTRAVFEKEEGFVNDRTALLSYLWDTSSKSYDEVLDVFPGYSDMTRAVSEFYLLGKKPTKACLEGMMKNLQKIDSTAKYSIAVALKKMYMENGS